MYLQAKDEKRHIFVESPYLSAEFTYDCSTDMLNVKHAECDKAETKPTKEPQTGPGKRTIGDIARGVKGIIKSELQINKVDAKTLAERWAACSHCIKNDYGFCAAKKASTGRACGCRVCDMIRDAKAECALPDAEKKWRAIRQSR